MQQSKQNACTVKQTNLLWLGSERPVMDM